MRADDTVWLGAILPLSGNLATAYGKLDGEVLDLARRDFAGVGGIPGVHDGEMRPLGLVLCDGAKNPGAAAAHVMDVGAPAVLVGLPLADVIELSRTTFFPSRAVVFDMLNQSPLVTKMPQPANTPRLVWRMAENATLTGEAVAHVISDHVDAALRGPGGALAKGGATKLAIVRSDASFASSVLDATASTVRLNGKGLADNNGLFRQLTFSRDDAPAKVEQLVAELVAFAPHVVAYADGDAFEDTYVALIERSWKAPYRPYFVSATMLDNRRLITFVGASAERRRRFLGVELPANTDENFRFVNHFNATHADKLTPATAPGVIFDAFYVAAYAATVSRDARVSGLDVAAGMARLGGDAPAVSVGANGIFAAYEALREGKMLRLAGAGTQLDFEHATGEIPTDLAVYCMSIDLKGQAANPVESGLRYDHRAKALVGKLDCP
jgi:hypothetical protein